MNDAWIAAVFGLVGSVLGAGATMLGSWLSSHTERKKLAEQRLREQVAVSLALAAELKMMAAQNQAITNAFARFVEEGHALDTALLKAELTGTPLFYSRVCDRPDAVPSELIGEVVSAYALFAMANAGLQRWALAVPQISGDHLKNLSKHTQLSAEKGLEASKKLVAFAETKQGVSKQR
ncbi:hypothetical protein [Arenimonas oryziterrae]|uniref:Uncharacterized protein n=1 Tax=Arenimonas oryziterrae DSM 21050 = YC6267 TaxID=1121015 RepID=A0A091BD35_9GAMM|nr:hypothetical protein [Arenimonas oryziterrae]KFN42315.1 hypothetical protein N789_14070 [Arenimonas oryziterrae DSM 21050 = YC6267]